MKTAEHMLARRLRSVLIIALLVSQATITTATAQDTPEAAAPALRFGHLSYSQALKAMPGYALAQQQVAEVRAQYEAEQERMEEEFNKKYEDFLDGQRDFPETILRKRQNELKQLMEQGIAFKAEARRQVAKAEADAEAPLRAELQQVLANVAKRLGLAIIFNTDANACPYISPELGIDVTNEVIAPGE